MADGKIVGTLKNIVGMKVDAEPAKAQTNVIEGEANRINSVGRSVDSMVKGYARGGIVTGAPRKTKSKFTFK